MDIVGFASLRAYVCVCGYIYIYTYTHTHILQLSMWMKSLRLV